MVRALLKNDIKYMSQEPTCYGIVVLPIAMTVVYKMGMSYVTFFNAYRDLIQYMFLTMGSVFVGVILGLRMLDEKDEQLLQFYAVSPLGLDGYYNYRRMMCSIISALVVCEIGMGIGVGLKTLGVIVIYGAILGGTSMLGVSCVVQNKIQGMVIAKGIGILVMLPCIRLLGENKIDQVLVLLPWDYLYQMIVANKWKLSIYLLYIVAIDILGHYFIAKSKTKV